MLANKTKIVTGSKSWYGRMTCHGNPIKNNKCKIITNKSI